MKHVSRRDPVADRYETSITEAQDDNWHQSPTGWWRKRGDPSLARWRTSSRPRLCDECRASIDTGEMYIVSVAPPWHEFSTARWYSHDLCRRHPDWAPPS